MVACGAKDVGKVEEGGHKIDCPDARDVGKVEEGGYKIGCPVDLS